MKYYVVIDTNVVVSAALKSNSNPGAILRLVDSGIIIPILNNKITKEYITVLKRKKFQFSNELVDTLIEMLTCNALVIDEKKIEIVLPDEKDRVFYEVVMEANNYHDSMLVTGNIKHFPIKPFILTPKELCDLILKDLENQNKK